MREVLGRLFWQPSNRLNVHQFRVHKKHNHTRSASSPPIAAASGKPAALTRNTQIRIPRLPVLEAIVEQASRCKHELPDFSKTAFIGVQHMLETTGSLFEAIIKLGVKPENMYFTGKCYSSSPAVEELVAALGINLMPASKPSSIGHYQEHARNMLRGLWARFMIDMRESHKKQEIERLVILDEGGRCLETMPESVAFNYNIASIEQTRGGLYNESLATFPFPVIDVATSAAKKRLESHAIAAAVLKEVRKVVPKLKLSEDPVFGVIGNGAIGKALTKYLLKNNYKVLVFDEHEDAFENVSGDRFFRVDNVDTLIARAECIFGCTGKDTTGKVNVLEIAKRDKVFISCSSEDKEFLSLLRSISMNSQLFIDPLSDIEGRSNAKSKISILRGGFPINFNGSSISVPNRDIQLTRGLLLGAFIQATYSAKPLSSGGKNVNKHSRHVLDPFLQRFVVKDWIQHQPQNRYSKTLLENFNNIEWIRENSGGDYVSSDLFIKIFSSDKNKSLLPEMPTSAFKKS